MPKHATGDDAGDLDRSSRRMREHNAGAAGRCARSRGLVNNAAWHPLDSCRRQVSNTASAPQPQHGVAVLLLLGSPTAAPLLALLLPMPMLMATP